MKKTLLIASVLLLSVTSVNDDVYALSRIRNMFSRNKDQDTETMNKAVSGFQQVYKLMQSISTNADSFTLKNFAAEDAIDILVTYRLFTKICADYFSWLNTLTSSIVTGYNGLKRANVSSEKARSQRASERAENQQMASKDKIQNAINCLVGSGMDAIIAHVKASAIIYIKMITNVEFSSANIDTLKRNSASLKKGLVDLTGTLDSFVDIFQRMSEENSDLEIDLAKIEKIKDVAILISDIMRQVDRYFNRGEQATASDFDDLLQRCSFGPNTSASDDDDGYNDDDTRRGNNRNRNSRYSNDDDDDDYNSGNRRGNNRNRNSRYSNDDDDDDYNSDNRRGNSRSNNSRYNNDDDDDDYNSGNRRGNNRNGNSRYSNNDDDDDYNSGNRRGSRNNSSRRSR